MNTRLRDRLWRFAGVALLGASVTLAGCDLDELLDVEDPDTVNPGTLEDPAVLDVVIAGALGDFTEAYSGDGGDAYLSVTGLMSDELFSAGTFSTRTATDRRNQQTPTNGNTSDGAYNNFHQARRSLREAAVRVADQRGTSDADFQVLKSLQAYTYVALAEGWCSAIPFSEVEDGNFVLGEPQTSSQVLNEAVTLFDEAGGGNLAAVGKGRALLNLGQYGAAASAVAGVPTDFTWKIQHSVQGDQNPLFTLQGNGRYSVSDNEGVNGLDFRSANDPRLPWFRDPDQPNGFDEGIPLFKQQKYNAFEDEVVLASGVEARLIEAEAALASGGDWLGILNDLRADVASLMAAHVTGYADIVPDASLDPLTDPGSEAARVDLLMRERAFWLFGTGHRLADLRRLVRDYGRNQADVYPTGAYFKGGDHGDDVVFPIDVDEENNENFDVSQCNVDSPA